MSAVPRNLFSGMSMVENPCLAVGIMQISCLVTEIWLLPVSARHIVFSEIGCCQPCQITCCCPWANPKHPYSALEFFKYIDHQMPEKNTY